jgi:class 3 adenylate cyclase
VPTFMDRHDNIDATEADIAALHYLDVQSQAKHGVQYLSYWHDPDMQSVFCFVDAPSKEAAEAVHAEAHGQVASRIIEVQGPAVANFLGPLPSEPEVDGHAGTGFRTILFTDIVDSTRLTQQLGDQAARELMRVHDVIVRQALIETGGHEVKHTGDGIMASFTTCDAALDAAVLIQRRLCEHMQDAEHPLEVRIGISSGEPVTEHNDLFGTAVQLAARACAIADVSSIFVSTEVRDSCDCETRVFSARGPFDLKGFADPIPLFDVDWRAG